MQNPLFQLEQFEKQLIRKPFKDFKNLSITFGGKSLDTMYITSGGKPVIAVKLERAIVHQIGARLYGRDLFWADIYAFWYRDLMKDPVEFGRRITDVLTAHDFEALMYQIKGGKKLYGIVTGRPQNISQEKLRYEILSNLLHAGVEVKKSSFVVNDNGVLEEVFETSLISKRISYNYVVSFARNNGYDTVHLDWDRSVIICRNGLKRIDESSGVAWYNSPDKSIKHLVEESVSKAVEQRMTVEINIDIAAESKIDPYDLRELMHRINMPKEKKPLILNQLKKESRYQQKSEWHLSQSLTYLASHSDEFNPYLKRHLRDAGTSILDDSLLCYLRIMIIPNEDGIIDSSILPKKYSALQMEKFLRF